MTLEKESREHFIDEYRKLCEKHKMVIVSCSCCDGTWLEELNEDLKFGWHSCSSLDKCLEELKTDRDSEPYEDS